jgi:Mg2+/Co2+ transporter CorB
MKSGSEKPKGVQKLVHFIYNHYDFALSTVLVGNNLVNIGATTVATVIALSVAAKFHLTEDVASTIVTVVMTVIILIVGEITPKMIARRMSEPFAKMAAYPILVLMILFSPVVFLSSAIVKLLGFFWKKKEKRHLLFQDILHLLKGFSNIVLKTELSEMIHRNV